MQVSTVMLWLQVVLLPHASVAFHVRVVTLPVTTVDKIVIAGAGSQLSLAVGGVNVTCDPHGNVLLAAHTITGAFVSTTVMACAFHTLFPQSSDAVQVRTSL